MTEARPRLLYLNGPWDYLGPRIHASYIAPFRRLLDQDFEVVSRSVSCDLREEIERHSPDLILFHTGTESPEEPREEIRNVDAYPEIPRIGYVLRDPFSHSRLTAINRLAAWKVDAVFIACRNSDLLSWRGLRDAIFVPWWIDDSVFRDYGERKTLPITLAGSGWLSEHFYSWRKPVFVQLLQRFPVYHVPAGETHERRDSYVAESYARLLNRSSISAGCGSVCRYLTLKMLEIPAARSCLLTEETELAKAVGFIDGVNCIFATPENVADKVQAVLDDPQRLAAITDAGFELVHNRHTQRQRRMFIEWFRLWRTKTAGQRVAQRSPFEPLLLVSAEEPSPVSTLPTENPLLEMLKTGFACLAAARWAEALAKFEAVRRLVPFVAEAGLGAAIAHIELGNWAAALATLESVAVVQQRLCAGLCPDPVVIAYHGVALARQGQIGNARAMLKRFEAIRHPALDAARASLESGDSKMRMWSNHKGLSFSESNTDTLDPRPERSFTEWLDLWSKHLGLC